MTSFDPLDPFPLISLQDYNYGAAKEHSIRVDRWLNFEIERIEKNLTEHPQTSHGDIPQQCWIGLDCQSFLTPYIEIRCLLDRLAPQPGDTVVDLGCGYGRMGHVLGRHHPEIHFIGYELVSERVREAQRRLAPFAYPHIKVEQRDLVHLPPPQSKYYFIYDYGSNAAIEKTLKDLQMIARSREIQIVARGRASRALIHQNHPWLCEVQEPRHFGTFSIYRS